MYFVFFTERLLYLENQVNGLKKEVKYLKGNACILLMLRSIFVKVKFKTGGQAYTSFNNIVYSSIRVVVFILDCMHKYVHLILIYSFFCTLKIILHEWTKWVLFWSVMISHEKIFLKHYIHLNIWILMGLIFFLKEYIILNWKD